MIADLSAPFDSVSIEYFGVFTRVSSFVRVPDKLYERISAVDQAILGRVSAAQPFSKYIVIRLDKSALA